MANQEIKFFIILFKFLNCTSMLVWLRLWGSFSPFSHVHYLLLLFIFFDSCWQCILDVLCFFHSLLLCISVCFLSEMCEKSRHPFYKGTWFFLYPMWEDKGLRFFLCKYGLALTAIECIWQCHSVELQYLFWIPQEASWRLLSVWYICVCTLLFSVI